MTRIKLCGLSRPCEMEWANELRPEYIGFVFAPKSRRYVDARQAAALKTLLDPQIRAVGVFVNARPGEVAALLNNGTIDLAQLHGEETEAYISRLRDLTDKPIIQAFRMAGVQNRTGKTLFPGRRPGGRKRGRGGTPVPALCGGRQLRH